MIKVGSIQNTLVLWQAVFLAASPLALAAPLPKLYFALAIPPAMQASQSSNEGILWDPYPLLTFWR